MKTIATIHSSPRPNKTAANFCYWGPRRIENDTTMNELNHDNHLIRQYPLAFEDGGLAWDQSYKLVFTLSGLMFVRAIKHYEQVHKTPDIRDFQPAEFDQIVVNGEQLGNLVAKKLQEILPPEIQPAHPTP